jgi:hypothetical protein
MNSEQKVTPEHLKRTVYLYVRQSTLRQVLEHAESARRQYALWFCPNGRAGASCGSASLMQQLASRLNVCRPNPPVFRPWIVKMNDVAAAEHLHLDLFGAYTGVAEALQHRRDGVAVRFVAGVAGGC